ncbi:MAG: RNA polymerase sigma factor [Lachnospiraceae bacterium]|nr:RNA polymerase sigma factor [Lachnospiraceae bacterium]
MDNPDFNEVYSLYFQDVFKFLLALCHDEELAEELTQETFFSALKNYESFRGECRLTSWLFQIAKNAFYQHQKRKKRTANKCVDLDTAAGIADTNTIEILMEQKDQVFRIHKLLHDLPEPYKEVFSLRILGELSYSDIAKLFGRTEEWARVTFYRAKLKISEQIRR